jgi:hypothetical protein
MPDVRDAGEQQNAVFEQFVNETYVSVLAEETSSVNKVEHFADATVTVCVKFTLKLSFVDMANHQLLG